MKVGWIGAGRMGSQMALRAARAGHALRLYASEITREAELQEAGVTFAAAARDAVRDAELVCLCVFSDAQARDAMFGPAEDGTGDALAGMVPGAILAIHTSGSPKLARDLAAAAPPGVSVIDAPFSGQQEHIAAGALTLLVGGDPAACERARPVFATYASTIQRVGGVGAAQRVKLVNQLLYRANLAAADAALRALDRHGIDRALAIPAMMACSGGSTALSQLASHDPAERMRSFAPYLELYLAAAAEDGLDLSELQRISAAADPQP